MHRLQLFFLLLVPALSLELAATTPADRLRELDQLRQDGLISEQAYQEQWHKIVAEGIGSPRAPAPRETADWGRTELSFSGSWLGLNAGDVEATLLSLQVDGGFMITEYVQLTGTFGYLHADVDGLDFDAVLGGFGANYHFLPGASISPYLGAGLAYVYTDLDGSVDGDDWAWEVRGGFLHRLTRNVGVRYQLAYQQFDQLDLDGLTASVGLVLAF